MPPKYPDLPDRAKGPETPLANGRIPNPNERRANRARFDFDPQGNLVRWPEEGQWPKRQVQVVCRTEGCAAKDFVSEITIAENMHSVYRVSCAQCKQEPELYEPGSLPLTEPYQRRLHGRGVRRTPSGNE